MQHHQPSMQIVSSTESTRTTHRARKPHMLAATLAASLVIAALLLARTSLAAQPATSALDLLCAQLKHDVAPLPPVPALDARLVSLGSALYHDPTLSKTNRVSCVTCHPFETGGTTREPLTSLGVNGHRATFNTPTTWNASRGTRQAWRSDAADMGEIFERPFFKDSCMGNKDWPELLHKLDGSYRGKFAKAGVAFDKGGVDQALVAYITSIEPHGSRADRWLAGDERALDEVERRGAGLFERIGCVTCHNGAGLGGQGVARFGLAVANPYADRGTCADESYCWSDADCGGARCTKGAAVRDADLGVPAPADAPPTFLFRVPSLRNVSSTAPYFHDGSARTLDEAVRTMARLQLGRTLTDGETTSLVAFLGTLTGVAPATDR